MKTKNGLKLIPLCTAVTLLVVVISAILTACNYGGPKKEVGNLIL